MRRWFVDPIFITIGLCIYTVTDSIPRLLCGMGIHRDGRRWECTDGSIVHHCPRCQKTVYDGHT